LQPDSFSIPSKSFTWVSPPAQRHQVLSQVQQSQPPASLVEVSSDSGIPASPAHRGSRALSVPDSRGGSPSTVPQVFSDTSGSPDKENNPPCATAQRDGAGVAWEDPAGQRNALQTESSPSTSSAKSLHAMPQRQVLQPALSDVCAVERPRRKSAQPVERSMQAAPRRKSMHVGDLGQASSRNRTSEGSASLVQEKISLWETMSGGSGGRAAKMSTSTSDSRGRGGVSGCAWYRCFSDMTRKMQQENAQIARLMERLSEVQSSDDRGSPVSTRSNEMSSPGEDINESPESQKIKAQLVDMNNHLKLTKKLYRAMDGLLRHSLEPVFAQESRSGRCTSTSLSTSPSSPRPSMATSAAGPRRSDKVFEEDTTACHSEVDSSRNSHSTGDSEGRPSQVQDSPRFAVPNWMRADLRADEKKKDELNEARDDLRGLEEGAELDEETATNTSSIDGSEFELAPLAGQEGMPRQETILYHLEQQELHRQVTLIVPEGMDGTRRVNFIYEDQEMTVAIPDGYDVGQQVTVQVPTRKRPPLERNSTQAWHRGHQHLPDRQLVMENLRHCCRVTTSISLDHPEYKSRYQLYGMLQGKSMTPMLPEMPEGDEEETKMSPVTARSEACASTMAVRGGA